MDAFTGQPLQELAGILVDVDGDPRSQLRGLVQTGGIRRANLDPGRDIASQILHGDGRLIRRGKSCGEGDALPILERERQHAGDQELVRL